MARKQWMQTLSKAEAQESCEAAAAFLHREGFANNDYSIAAIQTVDLVNLIELVAFFNALKAPNGQEIPLDVSTRNLLERLVGLSLSESDLEMLNFFSVQCAHRNDDRAMQIAGEEVQQLRGRSEFAGTVLLAIAQVHSDYAIDLLIAGQQQTGPLNQARIYELASNHWKRFGLEPVALPVVKPQPEAVVAVPALKPVAEVVIPVPSEPEPEPEPVVEPDPYIMISTHLGSVYVPDDEAVMHHWIAAANALQIRGYVALGDEIVILNKDGNFLRKEQDWEHDRKGYTYCFQIESIERNRVVIRAKSREEY
jgi:hypothetical protein